MKKVYDKFSFVVENVIGKSLVEDRRIIKTKMRSKFNPNVILMNMVKVTAKIDFLKFQEKFK